VQKPTQEKSDDQYKKYQQRPRHGNTPDKKGNIHCSDILRNEDHEKTGYDQNQY
jgi:hypothetical protein